MNLVLLTAGTMALAACNSNPQNEHGDHDHEHHEEMEEREGDHNHSQMEEHHKEMEGEESMHRQHESIRNNFTHQDILILDNPYRASDAVNRELKAVVHKYLEMKNALVKDHISAVDKAAADMVEKVAAVDESTLKGKGKNTWQQHASLYTGKLAEMQHTTSLEEKRSYFSHISEIVYCTVKSFGLKDNMELYATYCPMAFDNKGAYWLSETREVHNPYFGAKMLKCGKVKEEL